MFALRASPGLVGTLGFEPRTLALSRRCSNQLSYAPLVPASESRVQRTVPGAKKSILS